MCASTVTLNTILSVWLVSVKMRNMVTRPIVHLSANIVNNVTSSIMVSHK